MKRVQVDYIKEPCSDQTWCCNHQCIQVFIVQMLGTREDPSYLSGWAAKALLSLCKLTPWQLMLFCTTNASSPSNNLVLNETVHLSTSKTANQAVRLFQPTNQRSNEWPCSGWINTPFNDIIVFVRDKGQVLVGPYLEGHAMFYLNQFVFLLRL